jgi:hypothetical protein
MLDPAAENAARLEEAATERSRKKVVDKKFGGN